MRRGRGIAILALVVAVAGALVAVAAYLKTKKCCVMCEDLGDDLVDYIDGDTDCDLFQECGTEAETAETEKKEEIAE